jgi:c-di-GMP-binding flagellar brake protein YcgR
MENSALKKVTLEKENPADANVISINELLQVKIPDDPSPTNYYSRVNNVLEGRKFVIAWPTSRGIRLPVHSDQIIELSFVHEGIPYACNGLVDVTSMEPLPQVTIILNSEISQVQRRQNFRCKCLVPVEVLGAVGEDSALNREGARALLIRTVTYDLSAGGMAIRNPEGFTEGSLVDAKLGLPDDGPLIKLPCRIAYSDVVPGASPLYHMGMQFLAITERERARIVRHLYRLQLQSLHS